MNDRTPIQSGTVFALALICGTAAFLYTLYTGAPRDRRAYDAAASAAMSSRRAIGAMAFDGPQPRDRISLERAAAESPDDPVIFFNLGRIAESQGDVVAATKYFNPTIALADQVQEGDRVYLRSNFMAAWALDRLGQSTQALRRFRLVADGYDTLVRTGGLQNTRVVLQRIGWARTRLGDKPAALAAWTAALKLLQDRPPASLSAEEQYDLGCLLALTGQSQAALAALDTALAMGFAEPEWTRADEDLESLRDDPRFHDLLMRMEERFARRKPGE